MYIGLRIHFYSSLDEQVEDQTALTLITIQEQGGNFTLYPRDIGDLENDEHFVRLLTTDSRIVADTSAAVGGVPLDDTLVAAAVAGETLLTSASARGQTIRLVTAPVITDGEITGILQVGISREEIDEALWALNLGLGISGPVVLAVAVAGGYALAGRVIAPVSEITRQAASIDVHDLSARLNLDLPNDELGRLAVTFDTMLERIEHAFEQQRRFTGDAAHELRTPLSLMRSQIDLALLDELSADGYRVALHALQNDTDRLTNLVSALLALARADAGKLVLSRAPFDLAGTIEVVGEQFASQAAEAGVVLCLETAPCAVLADEDSLVQVLVNLVANALDHTPPDGTVTLGCRHEGANVNLWVADTGSGIPLTSQSRIFDRFYRVNHSLAREPGGAGLGLSISRTIVAAHGGQIDLVSVPGSGTTVTVILPASGDRRIFPPAGPGRSTTATI